MTLAKTLNSNFPSYLEGFFGKDSSDVWYPRTGANIPAVNISESNEEYAIEIAAPGFKKEDFKINLQNSVLTVGVQKEEVQSDNKKKFVKREFNYGSFERLFTLPKTVEDEKIHASYTDGVLRVFIPKKDEAKVRAPKSIEIK